MLSMPFFIQLFMKVQFFYVDVYACQFLNLCVVKGDLINARRVTLENALPIDMCICITVLICPPVT